MVSWPMSTQGSIVGPWVPGGYGCGPQAGGALQLGGCGPQPGGDLARTGYLGLVHHMICLGEPVLWLGWLAHGHTPVHATCTLGTTGTPLGLVGHEKLIVMIATKFQNF